MWNKKILLYCTTSYLSLEVLICTHKDVLWFLQVLWRQGVTIPYWHKSKTKDGLFGGILHKWAYVSPTNSPSAQLWAIRKQDILFNLCSILNSSCLTIPCMSQFCPYSHLDYFFLTTVQTTNSPGYSKSCPCTTCIDVSKPASDLLNFYIPLNIWMQTV